jgi:uncharacterized protein (DUF1015 family)
MIREVKIAMLFQQPIVESRTHLNLHRVVYYTRSIDEAAPVTVFDTGDELILADGYHRAEAARQLGRTTIRADVRRGSRSDALRFAVELCQEQQGLAEADALRAIQRRPSQPREGHVSEA